MDAETPLPFRCEYAKSNRSKCKACKSVIEKGEFRLGKMVRSPSFDGLVPTWFHVECFFKHPKKRGLQDAGEIEGLTFAKPEDQLKIQSAISGGTKSTPSSTASRTTDNNVSDESLTKERDGGAALVWQVIKSLEPLDRTVLQDWMRSAEIEPPKSVEDCREKLARAIVYGLDPACPDCKSSLHRCAAGYRCGARTEWGQCLFKTSSMTCEPFPADEGLRKILSQTAAETTLTKPASWKATAVFQTSSSVGGTMAFADDEDEAEPSGEQWHRVCFFCQTDGAREKILAVGAKVVKTKTAKTLDALVLGKSARGIGACEKAVLSLEKLEALNDVAEVFSNESRFLDLSPSNAGPDNIPRLKELWKRAHDVQPQSKNKRPADASGMEPENKKVKLVIKGRCAVDPLAGSEYVEGWRVYDPNGSSKTSPPYDAVLNLADVSSGTNSYYGLQVLECENSKAFRPWALFRKWGRIGSDRGGNKVELYANLEDAISQFETLFEDKTGTCWSQFSRGEFQKKPGKFAPVQVVLHEETQTNESDDSISPPSHGLDLRVADLIGKIFDVKAIEASLKEMEIDLRKMPLGNLTKSTVDQGYGVLQEIELALQDHESSSYSITSQESKETDGSQTTKEEEEANQTFAVLSEVLNKALLQVTRESGFQKVAGEALESLKRWLEVRERERLRRIEMAAQKESFERKLRTKLVGLSNKFYTLIPHDFGDAPPVVISTLEQVRAKTELLDVLAEVEAAVSILKRPGFGSGGIHPLRARYDELKSDLMPIENGDHRLELVQTILDNQAGTYRVKLLNLYQVNREGEDDRFANLPGKRMLLWHGSRLSNWGGILSRGLLIAPPSAPVSGYRLGKGVYFANVAEKSIGYAAPRSGQTILLLLCEVALGKPAELLRDQYMDKPIRGYDSTHALGTLTPEKSHRGDAVTKILGFEAEVPFGKPTH